MRVYLKYALSLQNNSSAKLPVLFWIPGGGYSSENAQYQHSNPAFYIDYGVVVVTVNYRVGAFGKKIIFIV